MGLYEAMEYKRRSKEMNDRGERRLRGRKLWRGEGGQRRRDLDRGTMGEREERGREKREEGGYGSSCFIGLSWGVIVCVWSCDSCNVT